MSAIRILLATLALLPCLALAHEGHDHGPPEPTMQADAAPRAAAESEAFELVAVLESGALTLYLDRHASNAPVADARVEVESGARKALAEARGPGVYALPAGTLAKPGSHPLTITVQAGEEMDLLAATLVVPPPAQVPGDAAAGPAVRIGWIGWAAGAALLGSLAVWLIARSRKRLPATGDG